MLLLPVEEAAAAPVAWKIWSLATWIDSLDVHPENEALLRLPGRSLPLASGGTATTIETDVLIVGAGNA